MMRLKGILLVIKTYCQSFSKLNVLFVGEKVVSNWRNYVLKELVF